MTTPIIERVRTIPLIIENEFCTNPMTVDEDYADNSGFPFDREAGSRDGSFRSQLDDIAKRHPEFAEHLGGFPFRGEGASAPRQRHHNQPQPEEFRRFDSPFGSSGFERFGFPFERDEFYDAPPPEERHPQEAPQQKQPQQEPQPSTSTESETKPPEAPQRGRKQQNIQQSNTVDLGQKQEPVNERNQRSMSAPPDNRQRFVSSINIPINRDGPQQPQQQQVPQEQQNHQESQTNSKPMERVIPIHVEGRDEPVMPKHPGPAFSNQQQHHQQQQHPEPERVYFGCGPFASRPARTAPRGFGDPRQYQQFQQQSPPPQQQYQPAAQQQHQQQPAAQQHQQPAAQQQHQQQQQSQPQQFQQQQQQYQEQQQRKFQEEQQAQAPAPQQQQQPSGPIELIQKIQQDVSELMSQVENFAGQPRDKQYLYLDEMLTRNLIKLDNIDTQGQENIRSARKEAIRCIERCIGVLDAKAAANVPQVQSEPQESGKSEGDKMEVVENKGEPDSEVKSEQEATQMDVESPPVPEEPKTDVASVVEQPKVEGGDEKPEEVGATTENNPPPSSEDKKEEEIGANNNNPDDSSKDDSKDKKKGKKKAAKK